MDGQTWEYKAFISYRHREFDRKVAVQLQKLLETYHIPRRLGKKENWKIFRDETELPASSDLSEDIRYALERSEFLIVICSTATKESKWCRQEIAHFKSLHQHTTKKICTLLIEGDPDSVFPEELCWSEMEKKEADGQLHRISVEVEPLAANIVAESEAASMKKLKAEFLRIAAPMLGVTYDTLKQRQRTYRYQRITAAAVGAAVIAVLFSGYAFRQKSVIAGQAAQITEEFTKNLLSQSKYYVKEAKELLGNNDIPGAVERLLAALPDENTNRPVYADAVYTLTDALGLYTSTQDVQNTVTPVKKQELAAKMTPDFLVDEAGKYIILSDGEKIEVRQAETFALVQTLQMADEGRMTSLEDQIFLKDQHSLLYITADKVCCAEYLTGNVIWENTQVVPEKPWKAVLSEDKKTFLLMTRDKMIVLDAETGKETGSVTYEAVQNPELRDLLDPEKVQEAELGSVAAVSADGCYAAFTSYQWEDRDGYDIAHQRVYVADLQKKKIRVLDREFSYIEDMRITDDGCLYVLTDTSTQGTYETKSYVMRMMYPGESDIFAWNLSDLSLRWETRLEYSGRSRTSRIETAGSPYASVSGQIVLAETGNRVTTVSADTGEIIETVQYENPVISVGFDGKNIIAAEENGNYTMHPCTESKESGENRVVTISLFTNNLRKMISTDGVFYALCEENETYSLLRYETERSDDRYRSILTKAKESKSQSCISAGAGWQYALTEDMLYLVDCSKGKQYEISLPEECTYLGMSADKSVFWLESGGRYSWEEETKPAVYAVYAREQKAEKKEIPLQDGEKFVDLTVADRTVYYLVTKAETRDYTNEVTPGKDGKSEEKDAYVCTEYPTMELHSWIPASGEQKNLGTVSLKETEHTILFGERESKKEYGSATVMRPEEEYVSHSLVADSDGQTVSWLLSLENGTSGEDEAEEQQVRAVQINTTDRTVHMADLSGWQDESSLSVTNCMLQPSGEAEAVLYDTSGDLTMCLKVWKKDGKEIQLPERTDLEIQGAFFSKNSDLLFVLYADKNDSQKQSLTVYDVQTGAEKADMQLSGVNSYAGNIRTEQISNTAFLLYGDDYAGNGYVIDEAYLDTGGILACIPSCVGTDGTDLFVYHKDISSEEQEWGSFPYMPVDELIKKGEAFLK